MASWKCARSPMHVRIDPLYYQLRIFIPSAWVCITYCKLENVERFVLGSQDYRKAPRTRRSFCCTSKNTSTLGQMVMTQSNSAQEEAAAVQLVYMSRMVQQRSSPWRHQLRSEEETGRIRLLSNRGTLPLPLNKLTARCGQRYNNSKVCTCPRRARSSASVALATFSSQT